jgi:hypothetical protein
VPKVTVLMDESEFRRLDVYCRRRGFKKSTLLVRLVRDHLDREGFETQAELRFDSGQRDAATPELGQW